MADDLKAVSPQFPCPVPPKPPIAREHCRHYSYVMPGFPRSTKVRQSHEGPQCAAGCDMSAPGAALPCMPPDSQRGATCDKREDWSNDERAAWEAWSTHHTVRMCVVLEAVPDDDAGQFPRPACGSGTVSYARARLNRHLHAACSTPQCFAVMQ